MGSACGKGLLRSLRQVLEAAGIGITDESENAMTGGLQAEVRGDEIFITELAASMPPISRGPIRLGLQ
jgi:hypothetical protein